MLLMERIVTEPDWFHLIQAASYVFASLAAVAAAAKYNLDRNAARKHQEQEGERKALEVAARQQANEIADRDLAWRKMEAAQKMLDAMSTDGGYVAATLMLDWTNREYDVGQERVSISWKDMLSALRTHPAVFDDTQVFIRDSFDTLFYFFERIHHQIAIGMTDIAAVRFPLRYYACRINENRAIFDNYLDTYTFAGAKALIDALLMEPGPIPAPHDPNAGLFEPGSQDAR
jgi:hypothetical protein